MNELKLRQNRKIQFILRSILWCGFIIFLVWTLHDMYSYIEENTEKVTLESPDRAGDTNR